MASQSATAPLPGPLVVIVGPTGVGKTRLGVDLAMALGGEVISADSMQVYRGFDVGSAKVTKEECCGVNHHLVDVVDAWHTDFDVRSFRRLAVPAIEALLSAGTLPVVVGGTFYYVEALMWRTFMVQNADASAESGQAPTEPTITKMSVEQVPDLDSLTPERAYALLQTIDPKSANRLHPHDQRKVRRSLEVYRDTGQRHSELLQQTGGISGGQRLQYRCVVLWLDCKPEIHQERLSARVDKMMAHGLLKEVTELVSELRSRRNLDVSAMDCCPEGRDAGIPSESKATGAATSAASATAAGATAARTPTAETAATGSQRQGAGSGDLGIAWTGVAQSIGFKEFKPYFELCLQRGWRLTPGHHPFTRPPPPTRPAMCCCAGADCAVCVEDTELTACLKGCLERLKISTRQYAKKQLRWIRKRFYDSQNANMKVYRLDTSDASKWKDRVLTPSLSIVRDLLQGRPPSPSAFAEFSAALPAVIPSVRQDPATWQKHYCEQCERTCNGVLEWKQHMASRAHRNRGRRLKRKREVPDTGRRGPSDEAHGGRPDSAHGDASAESGEKPAKSARTSGSSSAD